MKNIVLLGFMGTGKTVVGKKVARKLKMEYLDVDDLIEEEARIPISEVFSRFGEDHFRDLESKMVERVAQYENKVMATGGGIVLRKENMDNLRKKGVLICLTARPEVILERTKGEHHRPLLEVDYPLVTIKGPLKFRAPYYAQADYSLDTSLLTIDQVVEEVIKLVNLVR